MTPDLRVYLRDSSAERVAEIDEYGDLVVISRDNAVGSWTLEMDPSSAYTAVLDPDTSQGVAGIVVILDGAVIFSGPVLQAAWGPTSVRFSGSCDNYLLARHVAVPTSNPDGIAVTGVASTAMYGLVDTQIGPSAADPLREVAALSLDADQAVGTSIDLLIARYTPLSAALAEIALAGGGLRFWVAQGGEWDDPGLELTIVQRRDLRAEVILSLGAGTLSDFEHVRQGPATNVVYAASGAGGDGTPASPVTLQTDSASILRFGRVETFLTRPGSDDAAEIADAAAAALVEGSDKRSVTLTPVETSQAAYGREYGLGDVVTAVLPNGDTVEAVVREVKITVKAGSGYVVEPLLGTPGMSNDRAVSSIISRLNDRVRLLERGSGSLGQVRNLDAQAGDLDSRVAALEAAVDTATPVGGIILFPQATPPTGFLVCDGSVVARATYPDLFNQVGTSFNTGGETGAQFRLPNLSGRVPLGVNGSHAIGTSGGAESVTPDYVGVTARTGVVFEAGGGAANTLDTTVNLTHGGTDKVARDQHTHSMPAIQASSVMQPFLSLYFMIRAI